MDKPTTGIDSDLVEDYAKDLETVAEKLEQEAATLRALASSMRRQVRRSPAELA